jgi:hypothetical protein
MWHEWQQRHQLREQFAALETAPWMKIVIPSSSGGESYDVGIGTLSVYAQVFFAADMWGTPEATAELYAGLDTSPITTATCDIAELTQRQLRIDAQLQLPTGQLPTGSYLLRVRLTDGATSPEVVTQSTVIEFVDVLAEQRRQRKGVE